MPTYDPISCSNTTPTLDVNGFAHFDLTVTLRSTPPANGEITLACSPANALGFSNPYTFSSAVGTISLVSSAAITSSIQVIVKVTAEDVSICRSIWLCPTGVSCNAPSDVNCSTVNWPPEV